MAEAELGGEESHQQPTELIPFHPPFPSQHDQDSPGSKAGVPRGSVLSGRHLALGALGGGAMPKGDDGDDRGGGRVPAALC